MLNSSDHVDLMLDFLSNRDDPTILEFGVERGYSTKKFLNFIESNGGKVFSVDINDCSKISDSTKWKFLQSDDLKADYIIKNFPEIKNEGVDLIYIDSYHEDKHVQKLISLYFKYVKKSGAIFIDDVDSFPWREKKNIWNSIVWDLTLTAVKEFYYNNNSVCSLKVFFNKSENGLAMIYKKTDFGSEPKAVKKIWNYNIIFRLIYPSLRRIIRFLKLNKN